MTRLNIGSGRRKYAGYTCIDIEPKNNPDIVGDFRTMSFSEVDEIRAEHILEHFSRDEGLLVLSQWRDWLKPEGVLIVETPDFEYICKDFASMDTRGQYWLTRHAYGSQEADWAFHRDGWYEAKFRSTFAELGYDILKVERNHTRSYLPNIRVTANKGHPKI
jgi:predicted SAM-dependent methyltransferase